MLSILQIFCAHTPDVSVFLSFFSHESSVRQSHVHWKEAFIVGWKRWYQRWPSQIWHDLRATPSPMIAQNTKASMVQGLRLKSRDRLVSEQSLLTEQTRAYIFVYICLYPIGRLCLLVTCCLCDKAFIFPLCDVLSRFFTSQQLLFWMQPLVMFLFLMFALIFMAEFLLKNAIIKPQK